MRHLQLGAEREGRGIIRDGVGDVVSWAWAVAVIVGVVDAAGKRVLG